MPIDKTLAELRKLYGPTMTDNECVDMCNAAAWAHEAEGWGLSHKDSGTHGRRYDGELCCHDVLMFKDGRFWDVLSAAGAQSTPNKIDLDKPSGVITDQTRYWIAPIVPKSGAGPITPPPPPAPKLKSREVFAKEFQQVQDFYAAEAGLQRPGGMVLNGIADVQAMIEWGYQLMAGKTVDEVLSQIQHSHEWHVKHPK